MTEERDTIEVLTLQLRIPTEKESALDLCDKYHQKYFLPTIEEVLNSYPKGNDTVIQKLSIDLGEVQEEEIPCRLRNALKRALDEELPPNEATGAIHRYATERVKENPLQHFLEYIESGDLHAPFFSAGKCMEELLSTETTDRLAEMIKRDKLCFYRLTDELSAKQLLALLRNLLYSSSQRGIPAPPSAKRDAKRDDERPSHSSTTENNNPPREEMPQKNEKDTVATSLAPHNHPKGDLYPLVMQLLSGEKGEKEVEREYRTAAHFDTPQQNIDKEATSHLIEQLLFDVYSDTLKNTPAAVRKPHNPKAPTQQGIRMEELSERFRENRRRYFTSIVKSMETPKRKRFFIENAGLLLLNPFFQTLLDRLGYLDENAAFKSLEKQMRAAHLLRSVAYGFADEREAKGLTLCKVICGLPPQLPVGKEFHPTPEERTEVEEMLTMAKGYWHIMEGTSIDGLRQSFLQRPGIIEKDDSSWIVRVEGRSIDILLDDLPWGFKTYSAPWADVLIYVEWQKEL